MCDHEDDKQATYISILDICGHEVYMCECGALVDISAEKNQGLVQEAMTVAELEELVAQILVEASPERSESVDAGLVRHAAKYDWLRKGETINEYMRRHKILKT
jgi:hypothetical protein